MTFGSDLLAAVKTIGDALGHSGVTFEVVVRVPDVTTGTVSATPTSYTVTAPFFAVMDEYVDGDVITSEMSQCIVSASGLQFTPDKGQKVTVDTVEYMTVRVDPLYAQSTVVGYMVFMSR